MLFPSGQLIALCITNHETTDVLEVFLSQIKLRSPAATINTLMSDDSLCTRNYKWYPIYMYVYTYSQIHPLRWSVLLCYKKSVRRQCKAYFMPLACWQVTSNTHKIMTGTLLYTSNLHLRAWKNHLRGVNEQFQLDIYQTLTLPERERDRAVFEEPLVKFTQYWTDKVPAFIQYFQQYYGTRPGKCITWHSHTTSTCKSPNIKVSGC